MNKPPDIPAVFISVDLAREPDFALGPLLVRPSIRRAVRGDREEAVQPRVMQVLVALARANGGVVSREELIASCWDNLIVGDDSITHCIAKVRQLADCDGEPAFEIETIPRVGYRLLARAQPVEVLETEMKAAPRMQTADLAASSGLGGSPPRPNRDWRKIGAIAAAALLVGVVGLLLSTRFAGPSRDRQAAASGPQTTAAVLPFTPLYSDRNARVYADEISSDVADTLGQTDLNVISPALSFRFRGDAKAKAAQELHSDILVDGDVRREGDTIDVAVRVEDVASGLVLLSKDIVGSAAQPADLPDRVATFVAGALGWDVSIRAFNSGRRWDPRIRTGVLRALFQCPQDPFCSYEIGRKLVSLAPDNAVAQTILAIETTNILDRLPEREQKSAVARARAAAWAAIRLEPHMGEPYIALSQLSSDRATAVGEAYLRRGLSVDPDSSSLAGYLSAMLYSTGRNKEALAVTQRLAARYKFEDWSFTNQIWALLGLGRTDDAVEIAKHARRLWPDTQLFVLMQFDAAAFQGDPADAEAMLNDPVTGIILHSRGEPPTILHLARALRTRAAADVEALSRDCATDHRAWLRTHWCLPGLSMLGRVDDAFQLPPVDSAEHVLFWPQTASLRADPRFVDLAQRLGLVAYWKATHTRPDFCGKERAPVCRMLTPGNG